MNKTKINQIINSALPYCAAAVIAFALSVLTAFMTEYVSRNDFSGAFSWACTYPRLFFNTVFFIFLASAVLYAFTRRLYISYFSVGIITTVSAAVNYYKTLIRNEPFVPWDITIAGEAAGIMGETEITVSAAVIISLVLLITISAGLFTLRKLTKFKITVKYYKTLIAAVPLILLLCCCTFFSFLNESGFAANQISENKFEMDKSYKRNGFIANFILNMRYLTIEIPSGYSEQAVNDIVGSIEPHESDSVQPNIIIVMDESFSDISMFENVSFDEDPIPNLRKLRESSISGFLLSEQFGGGTSRSEFEVLTGNSTNYLPSGSTPYQQYMGSENFPSYVSYLKDKGYTTIALHPYYGKFWARDKIYPLLGFEKFLDIRSFTGAETQKGFVSDSAAIDKIIEQYEQNLSASKPFFTFLVTMQNHGSYKADQYSPEHRIKISSNSLSADMLGKLTSYATGIRDADAALGKLIDYFDNIDDPTIIVFFGDHLGNLGNINESYVKGGYFKNDASDPEYYAKIYSTPFIAWSNYFSVKEDAGLMSMNRLLPYVCNAYSLDCPLYFDFLYQQSDTFKGSAMKISLDGLGNPSFERSEEQEKDYQNHRILQYDIMFGSRYAAEKLFK